MLGEESLRELRQTRAFTATELRDLLALWRNAAWPNGAGKLYNASWYLCYGFAGFLAISVWMSINRHWLTEPGLAIQLAIAAIGFAATLPLLHWVSERLQYQLYWQSLALDHRYQIATDGIRRLNATDDVLWRWRGIERLIRTDRYIALISGGTAMLLAKAAFDGQDVDGFCAELERRWHAAKAQSA